MIDAFKIARDVVALLTEIRDLLREQAKERSHG